MLNAFIMGIVVAGVILAAICLFNKSDDNDKDNNNGWCSKIKGWCSNREWFFAILAGVIVGMMAYLATTKLAVLSLIVLMALDICLCLWWKRDGSSGGEMVPFIALAVLIWLPANSAAWAIASLTDSTFLTSVITKLPVLVLVASIGFFVIDLFRFRASDVDVQGSELQKRDLAISWVVTGVTILIAVVLMVPCGVAEGRSKIGSEITADWLHFYNLDSANDDDPDNDFNFGPSAYTEGADAKSVDAEFRRRLKVDPALAAATTATIDAKVGTHYLGEFYESCKDDWVETINSAKERWSSDQEAYYKELDAFLGFLDTAEVEIRDCQSVSDQMWMNPRTVSGDPDVCVLKTDDHSGHELVYTFNLKDNTFEVAFRLECGFQPTDVAEIMGIETQDYTTFVTSVTPGGDTPTPDNPTPSYNKDPSKAPKENTEPNDDSGSGSNTSSGGNSSTEEKSTNSNNYSSYDEYRKDMDAMNDANASQKVGGDSNTPSASSGGANVDSNADAGTGYGGIDKPTEATEPAKEAGTSDSIDSSPGEVWGGPSD